MGGASAVRPLLLNEISALVCRTDLLDTGGGSTEEKLNTAPNLHHREVKGHKSRLD